MVLNMANRTTEDFISDARKVHGDKYDYKNVKYNKAAEKVIIECPIPGHGKWETTYHSHIVCGYGCQKCGQMKRGPTNEELIKKFRSVHGLKYDYSEVKWNHKRSHGWHSHVKVRCLEHGYFSITPAMHYFQKQGCKSCGHIKAGIKKRKTFDCTIQEAVKVHGTSYIYLRQFYVPRKKQRGNRVYLEIICKKHPENSFIQRRSHHLSGSGCSICNESHGERKVANILRKLEIKYEREKTFPTLRDKALLPIDFWLPDLRIIIEFDGEQHYRERSRGIYKGKLKSIQRRDRIKDKWAKERNIPMLRIKWDENPDEKMIGFFSEYLKLNKLEIDS